MMSPNHRHLDPEIKGYATYENALKKLKAEIPESTREIIITMVAVNSKGRFIPVAMGQVAIQHGLHFRGIMCVAA
jgi:RNA:NAD 2'-phosphotransferase (TPT1/KptA family)